MLIKEYRIPLPMTVEEYRIAQLYMIAKKSREESKGKESGVEILVNEPYTDGPGGSGQFTHKVYHVGSHLPGWFKSLLPKSALTVEEEAWNAYPYTKTRFKCPFVEKFSLEIETYYTPDGGHQDNVFNLSDSEKRNRIVDLIDVVKDQEDWPFEDPAKEDPTLYVSEKTHRGPLFPDWIDDYWGEVQKAGGKQPTKSGKSIMCAYKLCKVEFKYWGMQSKIERFIHDVALRKTMLKAHSQAWTWQDEWYGLTMEDIREIERETAELLKKTFHGDSNENFDESSAEEGACGGQEAESSRHQALKTDSKFSSIEYSDKEAPQIIPKDTDRMPRKSVCEDPSLLTAAGINRSLSVSASHSMIDSVSKPGRSALDMGAQGTESDEENEDEFYDCRENLDDTSSLAKWSSMEWTPAVESYCSEQNASLLQAPPSGALTAPLVDQSSSQHVTFRRVQSMREPSSAPHSSVSRQGYPHNPVIDIADMGHSCPTTVLILVAHGGSVLDLDMEISVRKSDVTTFRGALESVMRTHYPSLVGHVVVKCIPCPPICTEALAVLSNLSPYSFDVAPQGEPTNVTVGLHEEFFFGVSNDHLPISAIPLFATTSAAPDYQRALSAFVNEANNVYQDFTNSEDGHGFCGQVVLIGDSVGAILSYDALCSGPGGLEHQLSNKTSSSDDGHFHGPLDHDAHGSDFGSRLSAPSSGSGSVRVRNHSQELDSVGGAPASLELDFARSRLDFEVTDFFSFGSPLGLVLAYRKLQLTSMELSCGTSRRSHNPTTHQIPRPAVHQMYNLFHPTDPLATRIEPLLSAKFGRVPPINVARYHKYPMGDGASLSLIEFIQANHHLFASSENNSRPTTPGRTVSACSSGLSRRQSEESILSGVADTQQLHTIHALRPKWWGPRRIDFALYCPEGLSNFPTNSLPHLFHSSYWESLDVISFVLRQVVRPENLKPGELGSPELNVFTPNQPREKWIKKRTSVKIRNGAANHRANDVIVKEGKPQTLAARFSYGPLDMSALTGERVDIHIMKEPPAGDWILVATEVTDKHGRITHTLKHSIGYGIYPVRMLVRGDHTMLHMYLAVVPPRTETVVFSIDGSFAASMSVTGKDPKVKAGAVDIVRHWQELGYLIVYVTGRPDMQLQRVVSWLAQHNFPHGLVSFADGFTTDPLRHKAEYLKSLKSEHDIVIHCAYGSSKDIAVYAGLGLRPDQIYIVGKASRKQQNQATILAEGYADHLAKLTAHGGSRPAQGNARMVIPKTSFGLPGQNAGLVRRRTLRATAKRTTSYPINAPNEGFTN